MDILRCQVQVMGQDGNYGSCGGEAKGVAIIRHRKPDVTYGVLLCTEHMNNDDIPRGAKADEELREHVRSVGAEPAF